jgi:hypothetical protein
MQILSNICTPHGLHAEMSIFAAEAKKNVLVKKPMAETAARSSASTTATCRFPMLPQTITAHLTFFIFLF